MLIGDAMHSPIFWFNIDLDTPSDPIYEPLVLLD
jgi:hypothetical protein